MMVVKDVESNVFEKFAKMDPIKIPGQALYPKNKMNTNPIPAAGQMAVA